MEKINSLLEIDTLRSSSQKQLGVLCFLSVLVSGRRLANLLAETLLYYTINTTPQLRSRRWLNLLVQPLFNHLIKVILLICDLIRYNIILYNSCKTHLMML